MVYVQYMAIQKPSPFPEDDKSTGDCKEDHQHSLTMPSNDTSLTEQDRE